MADNTFPRFALLGLAMAALAACGQKGPLYLPEAASEVVTRPAATPPESGDTSAPSSPQTPDSQPAGPSPAPEVTAPVGTPDEQDPKKDKNATPPPPRP